MKLHHLYIDELGSPNPGSSRHKYFVLSACSVPESAREAARQHAEQIKFKYWGYGNHDLVFHSMDIGRKSGAFSIFKDDPLKYQDFLNDLLMFLKTYQITLFINITDHNAAKAKNWDINTVLKRSSTHIIESFVRYLVGCKVQGKIIIESATDTQNYNFLKAFTFYLSPKAIQGINFRDVQMALTSLSIVTKKNHDIEEQIADLFAYAAKCKYEKDILGEVYSADSYEAKIVKILEQKLYKVPPSTSAIKKRMLNKIEPYKILTN